MMYAKRDGERVLAQKGEKAICPMCDGEVIAKCGDINVHHWAHKAADCDTWAEGESEWHLGWKEKFPEDCREVVMKRADTVHRADVRILDFVLEFQRSPITWEEIIERELFYENMAWVICAEKWNFDFRDKGSHINFRWKHPRKHWWSAQSPIYLDFCGSQDEGDKLFFIKKVYGEIPCGGWGYWVHKQTFLQNFRDYPLQLVS
tara:strand:+ start:109 stop:720 length:612 start_codon:yes stop_codon:yes gene_type:complete